MPLPAGLRFRRFAVIQQVFGDQEAAIWLVLQNRQIGLAIAGSGQVLAAVEQNKLIERTSTPVSYTHLETRSQD